MSTTPYALLGLLSEEPMSGYDIRRTLQDRLSFFWSESYGQIYPALRRLEAARLITPTKNPSPDARRRRVYTITPAGRERLRLWLSEPPRPQPLRNELLLKLFFGRHAPPGVCATHLHRLRIQQQRLAAALGEHSRQVRSSGRGHPDSRYALAVITFGLESARCLIEWSEDTLTLMGSGGTGPV